MNNLITINSIVVITVVILMAALIIGFCLLLLALQIKSDANKSLRRRNEMLKERLSDKEFELYLTRNGLWKE